MKLFFISYDLRKPGRDYGRLYNFLTVLGAKKVCESTYCFKSIKTASDLRDEFKQYVDANDGVVVTQIEDWSTFGAHNTPNDL